MTSCSQSEQLLFWQLNWKVFIYFYLSICLLACRSVSDICLSACLSIFMTSCWHSEQLLFWQLSWKVFIYFYLSVCLSICLSDILLTFWTSFVLITKLKSWKIVLHPLLIYLGHGDLYDCRAANHEFSTAIRRNPVSRQIIDRRPKEISMSGTEKTHFPPKVQLVWGKVIVNFY